MSADYYDEQIDDRRDRLPREAAAEARRVMREARTAFAKAARQMRRTVRVGPAPAATTIQRAGVILEPAGVFLSRAEIERLAAELVANYCDGG